MMSSREFAAANGQREMCPEPRSPGARPASGAATYRSSEARDEAKRILVVEDDAETARTLATVLEGEGYAISTASDGREALERLNHMEAPDLILLDLRMPVMDGWSFRLAQQRSSALAPIPVIAMSADGTSPAAAISADAFLKKPLSMPELVGAIERVLTENDRQKRADHWTMVERMASLGQVAAGVGHEINNPLAFVLINVTQVRDELREVISTAAPEARHLIELLDESLIGLERIRGIVQNVQSLSRRPDHNREPVRLDKILDDSITVARSYLQRARVEKRYADAPVVMGSPGALGEVFLNLLINAAQALPDGNPSNNQIAVTIAFNGSDVIVEIADTGHGIAPEVLPRIFDPFFTTKSSEEGTGLGLTICQRIINDHGGTLTIESDVGSGTVCRVALKPAPADASHAPATRRDEPGETQASRRGRILVIDDEPLIGGMITRTLSRGHEVLYAREAEAAFDLLERGAKFDVVLCDLTMPGMSGREVFDVLTARWPALASHLVFMTGGAFTERDRAYLQETTRPVLSKPFTAANLSEIVAQQLEPDGGRHKS
jgi:signal transduction histidine kinase